MGRVKIIGPMTISEIEQKDRIAKIVIKLNKRYNLRIIQVYASAVSHYDEEEEEFYDDIEKLLNITRGQRGTPPPVINIRYLSVTIGLFSRRRSHH